MPEETTTTPTPPTPAPPAAPAGLTDNAAGAIAYLTFIPAIVFLVLEPYNKNSFVRFHSWQSIFLAASAILINIGLSIVLTVCLFFLPFHLYWTLWRLIDLFWFVVWIVTLINAAQGKRFKLPFIGNLAEKQANQ